MSTIPLADVGARIESVQDALREALDRVLRSGRFILGPEVKAFEDEIAERCGATQGIGVSSGTDALLVAMMALGLGPGDEVITTPMSFFASVGSIIRTGATPVFADIEEKTFNLDASKALERVGQKTKAIEVVHLFGQCGDVKPLRDEIKDGGVAIIEDMAQALGASRDGTPAGGMGTVGCLSFFPTKNLGGIGDGGMVITTDDELADMVRMLRGHGARPKYYHHHVGGNFRLDELQAAALRVMLPKLDGWNEQRLANADRYDQMLHEAGLVDRGLIKRPPRASGCHHIFHHYVVRVSEDRDELREHLGQRGVSTAVYYPVCLHQQPCLKELGYGEGDFPVAEKASREVLALPVYPEITVEQQAQVVEAIKGFFL